MKKGGKGGAIAAISGAKWEAATTQSLISGLEALGYQQADRDDFPKKGPRYIKFTHKDQNRTLELYFASQFGAKFFSDRGLEKPAYLLQPDTAIFDSALSKLTIIEKKQQEVGGSVDEKLQTCDFKLWYYQDVCKPAGVKVDMYWQLGPWFTQDGRYQKVFDYMQQKSSYLVFDVDLPLQQILSP